MTYWSDLEKHGWDEIWMNHPAVRAWINERVTGDPARWPIWWLTEIAKDRIPFSRSLSVGCGIGNFERSLVELGLVRQVTGIDVSEETLAVARKSAEAAGMSETIAYVAADAREYLRSAHDLDAVFFHSSLHHFDRLPELLGLVREALAPRGILYLDEYAGPARTEWTWRELARWNAIYWRLPKAVRRTRVIRRPVNREDPTEAIESSGILPAVARHFRVIARRDYGGNLLAPIYPSLLRPDQPNGPSVAQFEEAVRSLMAREDALLRREAGFNTVLIAEARREAEAYFGKYSFGIGLSFVSSVQIALAIHQRVPSQKSSIELMPRMMTGPVSVRRDSYVLQTWAIGPKRSVTRWISFSKKPDFVRPSAESTYSWWLVMCGASLPSCRRPPARNAGP